MIAANKLAGIGMADDRTIPALCRAALKADDRTREVLADILQLALEKPNDSHRRACSSARYRTAVEELQKVMDNRKAAARIEAVSLLGRLIAMYQKT